MASVPMTACPSAPTAAVAMALTPVVEAPVAAAPPAAEEAAPKKAVKRARKESAGAGADAGAGAPAPPVEATTPLDAEADADADAPPEQSTRKRKAVGGGLPASGDDAAEDVEAAASLIVVKAVRSLLKNGDAPMFCGADALPALNAAVRGLVHGAIARAAGNGRKTLRAQDF